MDKDKRLNDALYQCLQAAKTQGYRSVDAVALAMNVDVWVLRKWVQDNRLPASQIHAFESACGSDALISYLAAERGFVLVPLSQSRDHITVDDALGLQRVVLEGIAAGLSATEPTLNWSAIDALTTAITALCSLRQRIASRPEQEDQK